ncbi:LOW QUALITY PROTEIN: uncharacterized protein LOC121375131 [Gigantopelta aegis]|uniref:LOW QUALITY PROTEIN: uncharacterized protein LOC121375131 n=1 Tax=Gigantopelta aegis TaxID=1735272 RepID=UPI001B88AEBA|nr:LOW QUALITY PROTEIN: uncharacterized protein LOC121375131 [Gigantopelta aegis]
MARAVLLKRLVISVCRQLLFRHIPRLLSSWKHMIISCLFVLLVTNIIVFYKGCRSTFLFGEPTGFGKEKHGHVMNFPEHHFEKEYFNKGAHPVIENLMPMTVPLTVHFVWCNQRHFQFQNYLSVLGAYKFLHPVEILFHYSWEPELDSVAYYQFYADLLRDIPVFFSKSLEDTAICTSEVGVKVTHIASLLNKYGGIYIDINTIISQNLNPLREKRFSYMVEKSSSKETKHILLMLMGKDVISSEVSIEQLMSNPNVSCTLPSSYSMSHEATFCVHVDHEMFPVDIFELQTDFGQLARWVGYGTKSVLRPQPHKSPVIPNIVHYVWLGSNTFSFFSYLSLLSTLHVLKADAVYIHGDHYPTGKYWDKMKGNERVEFIFREVPSTVFGHTIGAKLSHASDFIRVDVLLRYGGIYMDWDVLWVNSIPESLRKYDFVACADWPRTGSYPDVFNMGLIAASNESVFLQYFMESFRHYIDSHWSYNAIHMPYKVYEKHPDQLFHYRHFQVICAEFKCHPVWMDGYKDDDVNHLTTARFDWRRDILALHWTYPDPPEFDNEEILRSSHGMFSDIGKYILEKAGIN